MPEDKDTASMRRLTGISLTREERDALHSLVYNVLSQDGWPAGLDTPNDVPGTLEQLEGVRTKLERVQASDRDRPPRGRPPEPGSIGDVYKTRR